MQPLEAIQSNIDIRGTDEVRSSFGRDSVLNRIFFIHLHFTTKNHNFCIIPYHEDERTAKSIGKRNHTRRVDVFAINQRVVSVLDNIKGILTEEHIRYTRGDSQMFFFMIVDELLSPIQHPQNAV